MTLDVNLPPNSGSPFSIDYDPKDVPGFTDGSSSSRTTTSTTVDSLGNTTINGTLDLNTDADLDVDVRFTFSYSLKTDTPAGLPPNSSLVESSGGPGGAAGAGGAAEVKNNPWFNPSFEAIFSEIITEIENYLMKMGFAEDLWGMINMQARFEMGMDRAELKEKEGELEAEQKYLEAMSEICMAVLSGVEIGTTMSSSSKGRQKATEEYDNPDNPVFKKYEKDKGVENDKIKETEKEIDDLREKRKEMDTPELQMEQQKLDRDIERKKAVIDTLKKEKANINIAGDNPQAILKQQQEIDTKIEEKKSQLASLEEKSANLKAPLAEIDKKIQGKEKEIETAENNLIDIEAGRESAINERATMWTNQYSQTYHLALDGIKSAVRASFKFLQGNIDVELGLVRGQIERDSIFEQMYATIVENAQKARDKSDQEFNRVHDLLTKIIDSSFNAHSLRAA
jgi:hypothetical protein